TWSAYGGCPESYLKLTGELEFKEPSKKWVALYETGTPEYLEYIIEGVGIVVPMSWEPFQEINPHFPRGFTIGWERFYGDKVGIIEFSEGEIIYVVVPPGTKGTIYVDIEGGGCREERYKNPSSSIEVILSRPWKREFPRLLLPYPAE
ncbi:MAG: hypothetical protein ACPLSJ_07595, partial [Thermosulfidibacteraceae bacterium]